MDSYVKNQLKRKVSSFILSEAGKVGNRNTFSAAALVTASSLATLMLTTKSVLVQDNPNCGPWHCDTQYCCVDWDQDPPWYGCADFDESSPDGPVDDCWLIN